MDSAFQRKVDALGGGDIQPWLMKSYHGLEKECLRVDADGTLALTAHPEAFGSPLLHPFISTDFSESQLELISPVFPKEDLLLQFMNLLHRYLYRHIGDERLWPFSSPCALPSEEHIPIAQYGNSSLAKEKELYRLGLAYRYGRKMQALSGVHYNFSFSRELLSRLFPDHDHSSAYLHIVRNYLRYGWIVTYLFGSTPVVDSSYFDKKPKDLRTLAPETIGGEFATSLRMSHYGYYSKLQNQIRIGFNTFDNYISDLESAVSTPAKQWKSIGERQINDHIIQIEAEHYSRIRPKPPVNRSLRPIEGLKRDGIVYLEVRGMDLNPHAIEGTNTAELYFLHTFLLYCSLLASPPLTRKNEKQLTDNQDLVALFGRAPNLKLSFEDKTKSLKIWSAQILEQMMQIAQCLDNASGTKRYSGSIEKQLKKIENPDLTPSSQLLSSLADSRASFNEYALELANRQRAEMLAKPYPEEFMDKMEKASSQSKIDLAELEEYEDFILKGYEDLELSTQALIREAQKRKITIDVLDRKANFIRLTKDGKTEYVKNATMTSKDNLISYWMMENKELTKTLLAQRGISVPRGKIFETPKEALKATHLFENKKIVIKPNRANYGIGVYTVESGDLKGYEKAVGNSFLHGQEVVVEEFVEGEEYRFLVIDGAVCAICVRIPANIIGDGTHSISELIHRKNHDTAKHKIPKYYLKEGDEERDVLKRQGLDFESVPEKDKRIFLRDNSNVSTGGDSIDKTDEVHPNYSKIAAYAAEVVNAKFCGVDMIIQRPGEEPNPQNHAIIELNFNPALWIHRYPTEGQKRYVEKAVLDTLGL